jgi:hypothetical protein
MAEAMLFYGCAGIFPHPHFLGIPVEKAPGT